MGARKIINSGVAILNPDNSVPQFKGRVVIESMKPPPPPPPPLLVPDQTPASGRESSPSLSGNISLGFNHGKLRTDTPRTIADPRIRQLWRRLLLEVKAEILTHSGSGTQIPLERVSALLNDANLLDDMGFVDETKRGEVLSRIMGRRFQRGSRVVYFDPKGIGSGQQASIFKVNVADRTGAVRPLALKILALPDDPQKQNRQIRPAALAVEALLMGFLIGTDLAAVPLDFPYDRKTLSPILAMELGRYTLQDIDFFRTGVTPKTSLEDYGLLIHVMGSVFEVVQRLGQVGMIHRDLKPANLLYDPMTQRVKFIDFGVATFWRGEVMTEKTVELKPLICGSPAYMHPRTVCGEYGGFTDPWSATVMLYKALTGKRPFPKIAGRDYLRYLLAGPQRGDHIRADALMREKGIGESIVVAVGETLDPLFEEVFLEGGDPLALYPIARQELCSRLGTHDPARPDMTPSPLGSSGADRTVIVPGT